jgi:SAM-dependent methyltransferase
MSKGTPRIKQCPACNCQTALSKKLFIVLLMGEPCKVIKCKECGLIYKEFVPNSVGQIYSADYVHFQTENATITMADINSAKQKLARCRKLLGASRSVNDLRLLDVGCGFGTFVEIARNLGYSAFGIDPYLPEKLQKPYLRKETPEAVTAQSYDIAVLLNVAEHLENPEPMFTAVRRLLKPDGVLLLTCPFGNSLARRFYKSRWGHLALEEHLLFWTPDSLTRMLRKMGFSGDISYRIAGSPFPYGVVNTIHDMPLSDNDTQSIGNHEQILASVEEKPKSFQARVWQLARLIQQKETVGNLVRHFVNISRTGDYLEYAIRISND